MFVRAHNRWCFGHVLLSCLDLLFVPDLFQSTVRISSSRYLLGVIPVHICYGYWNNIIPSSFPSSRSYALNRIFVVIYCRIFAKHSRSIQKTSDEILTMRWSHFRFKSPFTSHRGYRQKAKIDPGFSLVFIHFRKTGNVETRNPQYFS